MIKVGINFICTEHKSDIIMKKIVYLLLLSISLSYSQTIDIIDFKVNEPANNSFASGTKFDFEFKIKGDYTYSTHGYHQIDLIVYKDAISSSNEIARSYWNREDDYDLDFSSYTLKNWWNTSLINYSTESNKKFILVVKYAGLTKTLIYNYPNLDSDGDGVLDSQDNCPNESGPASNNGCPGELDTDGDGVPDSQDDCPNEFGLASNDGCPGEPDLSIDLNGSVINSNCFECATFFSQIGTDRHYLNNSTGIANVDLFVQNLGNTSSSPSTVGYYISANSSFESNSDTLIKTTNIDALGSNSGNYFSTALFSSDFKNVSGNFWLLIRVDDDDDNNESNETNNVFALRFAINN